MIAINSLKKIVSFFFILNNINQEYILEFQSMSLTLSKSALACKNGAITVPTFKGVCLGLSTFAEAHNSYSNKDQYDDYADDNSSNRPTWEATIYRKSSHIIIYS